jgi:hypothetical protein
MIEGRVPEPPEPEEGQDEEATESLTEDPGVS